MKVKSILPFAILVITPFLCSAQWTTGSGTIYTTNNVGIGTTSPTSKLSVIGGPAGFATNNGQYTLGNIDNINISPLTAAGTSVLGLFGGDLMLRSYWGISLDLNDGVNGDSPSAPYTRVPSSASFTINSRNSSTSFSTLFIVRNSGNVGIGTTTPDSKLAVNGTIHSTAVRVDLAGFSDYVFKPTYVLPSLSSVSSYVRKYQHLPEIPSEQEVIKNGLDLGQMNNLLVKKVEELTLYLIEKDKELKQQRKVDLQLASRLKKLEQKFASSKR
jgi:hypothetical protein